jgi:hypothetical protein
MPAAIPTRRRRLRFGLRTLFVCLTLCCAWLAWEMRIVSTRRAMLESVRAAGGGVIEDQSASLSFPRRMLGDRPVRVIWGTFSPEEQQRLESWFGEAEINPNLPTPPL